MEDCTSLNKHEALYIIRHVFLPPQLPSEDDSSPCLDRTLLSTLTGSLARFVAQYETEAGEIAGAADVMQTMTRLHKAAGSTFAVNEEELKLGLQRLVHKGTNPLL